MASATANGVRLEFEVLGDPGGAVVLLIMGVGAPLTRWPDSLCEGLAAEGFRTIRFDNRDVGRSEKIDAAGLPDMGALHAAVVEGKPPPLAYDLGDMAADAVGLLDALGVDRAHVVGASMGGMIAQTVAARHPGRVASLVSLMSTTGNPALPSGLDAVWATAGRAEPIRDDPEASLEALMASAVVGRSPGYPWDEAAIRERARAEVLRGYSAAGRARQLAATLAAGDRRAELGGIRAPTIVIHGTDDPLFSLAHGEDTARVIGGSELRIQPGLAHDVPEGFVPDLKAAVVAAAGRGLS